MKLVRAVAVIAITRMAVQDVHAAEADAFVQLDEVIVVASKIPTPYAQIAATVTAIDASDIDSLAATDVRDLAQSLPGLSLRRDPTRFGLDTINIRGIGGNRVAVLIDGVPVSKGFAIGNYSDSGRPLTDLDLVRRIEILRGPASALYGSDAIGGVVSLATFDPNDLLNGETSSVRLRTGYDSRDEELRAGLDLAAQWGPLQGIVGYTHRTYGELDTTGALSPNPRDGVSDALNAKLVWPNASGGSARLMMSVIRSHADTSVDSLLRTPGRFATTTSLNGDDTSTSWRVALDQELRIETPWATRGEWRLYWSQSDVQQLSDERRTPTPPAAPTQIARAFNLFTSQWGGELTLSRQFESGPMRQRLVYGVEIVRSNVRELRDGRQTNLNTQVVSNNVLGEIMPVRDFPVSHLMQWGAYLQDDIHIGDGWSIIPALRFDYYDLAPQPDDIYLQDNANTTAVSVETHSWTPKLGVVYSIREDVSLFAQYAHGFRAPPFEDVNIGLDIPTQNIRAIPNPDLRPERSNGYELGARIEGAALRGSLSVFYNDYTDFIESKVNLGPNASGVTLFQSRNAAEARIFGVEAQMLAELGRLSEALDQWRISAMATWGQGDDLVRHAPLNSVEPAMGWVKVSYVPKPNVTIDCVANVVQAKTRVADPTTGTPLARTSGYTTIDAYLHWRPTERIRFDVALLNLLDREYQVWADLRGRANNDSQLPLYYQPGRGVSLSLKWQL